MRSSISHAILLRVLVYTATSPWHHNTRRAVHMYARGQALQMPQSLLTTAAVSRCCSNQSTNALAVCASCMSTDAAQDIQQAVYRSKNTHGMLKLYLCVLRLRRRIYHVQPVLPCIHAHAAVVLAAAARRSAHAASVSTSRLLRIRISTTSSSGR
jgi:hypothetical protein